MTELVWDGKYRDGKRQGPVRIDLPFQTIETVNETTQDRQHSLQLFEAGRETSWKNRLIWGDKKYVLPSLLAEFSGKINLIYIDPPYATGADFSLPITIPEDPDSGNERGTDFTKEPSVLEQKAYRDTWGRGLDSYLQWLYEAVTILRDLLSDTGSLYVQLDWHIGPYAKVVLDDVFGIEHALNEIVWKRTSAHSDTKRFSHVSDTLFFYSKSDEFTWNPQYIAHDEAYIKQKYSYSDADGRRYRLDNMTSPNPRPNMMYTWKGFPSPPMGWRFKRETMEKLDADGRIVYPNSKKMRPQVKRYLDEMPGVPLQNIWTDINPVNSQALEATAYPTQKPEALLERIIKTSTVDNDLVLDCFNGSGTTTAVAEKLNRRWIGCDLSRFAIHTTRKRLLAISGVKPFVVQNLGKYERQAWQVAEFIADGKDRLIQQRKREAAYREFILDLYHATPLSGHSWLHGTKTGRMVYVGAVDAPVTLADVKSIARDTWKTAGSTQSATRVAVDILGWEFAFEVNELAKQVAADSRVSVTFRKIPREVLDRKAVDQGDVRFFELGAVVLELTVKKGHEVMLELSDFLIPTDDIPEEARRSITHWSQLVDYWAVDWNFRNDTFHNEWQSFRTRRSSQLEVRASHSYPVAGTYRIVVKVIDLLGNDTTTARDLTVH